MNVFFSPLARVLLGVASPAIGGGSSVVCCNFGFMLMIQVDCASISVVLVSVVLLQLRANIHNVPRGMNCRTLTTTLTFPASSPPAMLSRCASSDALSDGADAVDSKERKLP